MRRLPRLVVEPTVRAALLEDLGRAGDLTTDSIIGPDAVATVQLVSRDRGVLAGLPLARLAWELVDARIECDAHLADGARLEPGSVIATVRGPARGLLTGERVALNFLGHLSGVHRHGRHRRRHRAHPGQGGRHPQDHPRAARAASTRWPAAAGRTTASAWTMRC